MNEDANQEETHRPAPAFTGLHIPSLDGFRMVAVSLVFVAHAGLGDIVPGGFGVTLFFFLSGYLITTLLRVEFEKRGRISIPKFYMRRFLRIFPPLYITTTVMLLVWAFGYLAQSHRLDGQPWNTSTLGIASHYLFFTNYFNLISTYDGLPGGGPLWSLAVEEHFYLLFPVVFALLMVRVPARRQAAFLLGFCALVLVWRFVVVYASRNYSWTYLATDTRLDSIAFGCLLAVYRNPAIDPIAREKPLSMRFFWLGVAALLLCFIVREGSFGGQGAVFRETLRYSIQGLALIPIFTVAILQWDKPMFGWLNTRFAKWMASLSYTIYLVHDFGFLIAEEYVTSEPIARGLAAGVLVLGYAWLMYVLIERPIARMRKRYA